MDEVYEYLDILGVPQHINGYHYIHDAIIFIQNNHTKNLSMTSIYHSICPYNATTALRAERCIRTAIHKSFYKPTNELIELFRFDIEDGIPNVKKFLYKVSYHMLKMKGGKDD